MILQKKHLFIAFCASAVILTANALFLKNSYLGLTAFLLYLIAFGLSLGLALKPKTQSYCMLGFLLSFLSILIICASFYYIHSISTPIIIIITWMPIISFLNKFENLKIECTKINLKNINKIYLANLLLFVGTEAYLFFILISNRTDELLRSPWNAIGPSFFILYFLATILIILLSYTAKNKITKYIVVSAHLFLTYSIAAIIYRLGFGFDAFVHRATESWILNYGFINPKTPYYIGQYSLVVWLAKITAVPIFYIDTYLVPILASLSLPILISETANKVFQTPKKIGVLFSLFFPFITFFSFHLTTPYNLALLIGAIAIFSTMLFLEDKIPKQIPLFASIACCATHPLLGAPTFLFVLCSIFAKQTKKIKTAIIVCVLSVSFLVPLLFTVQILLQNQSLPQISNPISKFSSFASLFEKPYWYAKKSFLHLEILYLWQKIYPVIFLAVAGAGMYLKRKNLSTKMFIAGFIGMILSAYFLRSFIIFPDVAQYEQGDYPLRTIKASFLFLLPFAIFMAELIIKKILNINKKLFVILIAAISALLMIALYLSYPQHNDKARFPGLNVTKSDFNTVEYIHNENPEINYIVLANQLVSAAALEKYSFAKYFKQNNEEIFYYSLPTGGKLYQFYGKMLYEGQKREYMESAMRLAGVKKSYFVLNSYWANADKIIENAKKTADSWQIIDNGNVWVFVYNE